MAETTLFKLTFWAIPPSVSAVTLLALAAFALFKGKGRKGSLSFASICLIGGILSVDKTLSCLLTDPDLVLRFGRADHMFVVFFVPLYLHFTYTFLGLTHRRWLTRIAYAFAIAMSLSTHGSNYFTGVARYSFGYFVQAGPLAYLFGAVSVTTTTYCLLLLYQSLRRETDAIRRNKTKYILAGLGSAALMTHANFLPIMGFAIYPLGNFAFIPLLVLAYALLKHDILDIGFALRKRVLYPVATTGAAVLCALSILLLSRSIPGGLSNKWAIVFLVLSFSAVAFHFEPLKRRILSTIDSLFFRQGLDYRKALTRLSLDMASMLDLDEIIAAALKTLNRVMRIELSYMMLKDSASGQFRGHSLRGIRADVSEIALTASSPLLGAITHNNAPVTYRMLEQISVTDPNREEALADFSRLGGVVIIPMIFKGAINGLLVLGNKITGGLFTEEDHDLLRALANQCAISVENARAYRVIDNMKKNLEQMVEERTQELKNAQELLIRSESLAAIGALVAGVAHELNNPLASASSLVQSSVETMEALTRRNNVIAPEINEDLKFCLKELKRAGDIVRSLLGISRQTDEYTESIAINDLCEDALKVLATQYKHKEIKIHKCYETDLAQIHGNFANLGQVFLNIVLNAIQAIGDGKGTICLRTFTDKEQHMLVFECEDNGPGIPEAIVKDLFKPFFTTKDAGKGTGLGLYICHEITRKHNGRIHVLNNLTGGATFRVELPLELEH